MISIRTLALLVLVPIVALAGHATAQTSAPAIEWESSQAHITRAELEVMLTRYQEAAESNAYSRNVREQARWNAREIQRRLEEGDFRVGDRIALYVARETELTDTFAVRSGRVLTLPQIGEIPMDGVLRAELQDHLEQEIGRYIRDPVVRANALIPLTVTGAVGNPGFYTFASDALVTDILMDAGGPGGQANLDNIKVERQGETIWEGDELQRAITQGRTLDQLNLQPGDRVVVPEGGGWNWREFRWILGTVSAAIVLLSRVF